jgi:hypothetical protein
MKEKKAAEKKGVTKKEIRSKIQDSLNHAIVEFEKEGPSKRVKKVVQKASKRIASKIKRDLKKAKPKKTKAAKKAKGDNVKTSKIKSPEA